MQSVSYNLRSQPNDPVTPTPIPQKIPGSISLASIVSQIVERSIPNQVNKEKTNNLFDKKIIKIARISPRKRLEAWGVNVEGMSNRRMEYLVHIDKERKASREYNRRPDIRKKHRDAYRANPEISRKRTSSAYWANPEISREKSRDWYWANAESRRKRQKEEYWANPEISRKRARDSYWANAESRRERARIRMSRKKELDNLEVELIKVKNASPSPQFDNNEKDFLEESLDFMEEYAGGTPLPSRGVTALLGKTYTV